MKDAQFGESGFRDTEGAQAFKYSAHSARVANRHSGAKKFEVSPSGQPTSVLPLRKSSSTVNGNLTSGALSPWSRVHELACEGELQHSSFVFRARELMAISRA